MSAATPIREVMRNAPSPAPARHIGDCLDPVPGLRRRSVLLAGSAAALAALAGTLPSRLAGASPTRTPATKTTPAPAPASAPGQVPPTVAHTPPTPPASVLPLPERAPAKGEKAREPYTSGGIGRWQDSSGRSSTPEQDRAVAAASDGLFVLGDSVGTRLLPGLTQPSTRAIGWDVWNGRPTAPAIPTVRTLSQQNRLPRDILVVLGSNDVFDPHRFPADAAELVAALAGHRVFWVTPYVSRKRSPAADMRASALLGLALERLAAREPQVQLVPWFELIARKPSSYVDEFLIDGVHPSKAGVQALAELTAKVLNQTR
ncbi:SGNH/GDSL hydrolase family protein [Gephyromycinifex aptenodytis]|uniref:hypothetical protein n=1 Tax=Gephyromycinifex aptenodytis TaxID=2716227 RepID=UPI001447DC64|nr:hypothetical protein [Gephyromycinifex aptenodytis]